FKIIAASSVPNALMFTLIFALIAVQPIIITYSATRIRKTDPTMLFPVAALALAMITAGIRTGVAPERGAPDLNKRVANANLGWDFWEATAARFPGNTSTLKRQLDAGGYDSLLHRDVVGWLKDVNGADPAPAANGNLMFVKPTADTTKLAATGVSEFTQLDGTKADLGGFRASLDGKRAEIVEQTLSTIRVRVPGPGKLTVFDHNLGGWTASQPLESGPWLQTTVPDGVAEVTFRYTPPGLTKGLIMFLVGLVGVVGISFWGKPKKPIVPDDATA
ncbi:MAG: hypothetical protein ABL962_04120, partial [Fimbriimonadaceae bacterium]